MSKKYLPIIIFSAFSLFSYGQKFDKKYFIKTNWFTNNKDSLFYKADTLKFIKHINYAPKWAGKEYSEYEMKYLNHGDFIEIGFNKQNELNFNWRQNNSFFIVPIEKWNWKYDKKENIVSIYDNKNVLIISFIPISEKRIKIDSRFAGEKKLETFELIVKRVKK